MAMFAIGVAAATAQVATMNLSGSVPAEMNGKKMYIINLDTRERIDSAVVKNGKLVFATEVGAGEAVPAAIAEGSKRRLSFILEPGTATINDRGQVKGTRLNNIVEGVGDMLDSLTVDYKARQKQIMQSQMSNDEKMKAAETLYNDVAQKSGDILVETYKANKTNAAGYMLFLQIADGMTVAEMDELLDGAVQWIKESNAVASYKQKALSMEKTAPGQMFTDFSVKMSNGKTVAEMDELLDGAVQWIKESNAVASYKQKALSMEKTAPGQMFTDFSVKMSNGKTVKLSDYVGKGDYVVLDFFASWCGPCRREMPTLKGIYEKYNGKGLKVVGLAVWDEPADTKKCVKELALPWTIIDNAQSEATEIYGVSGIPHIIVFAPDGTILARDLRGNDLAAKVDELLAK